METLKTLICQQSSGMQLKPTQRKTSSTLTVAIRAKVRTAPQVVLQCTPFGSGTLKAHH